MDAGHLGGVTARVLALALAGAALGGASGYLVVDLVRSPPPARVEPIRLEPPREPERDRPRERREGRRERDGRRERPGGFAPAPAPQTPPPPAAGEEDDDGDDVDR